METERKNSKGLGKVAIAQILATVLGAIFWLILAFLIHPVAYGRLSWIVSIGMVLSTFCVFGLGKTVATYYPRERDEELLNSSRLLVLILSIIIGSIASLFLDPFLGPLILGYSLFSLTVYSHLGKRQYGKYMYLWVSVKTLALLLPLAIYFLFKTVPGMLLGIAASYLLLGSKDLKKISLETGLDEIKDKIHFTLKSLGADLGGVAISFLDKILIGVLFGMSMLGYYQFAFRIFVLFTVLPKTLFFYLLPEKSAGNKRRRVEVGGVLISLLLTAIIFISAPYFIPKAFPNFSNAVKAVQILGFAIIPASLGKLKSSTLYSENNAGSVLISNIFALSIGIIGILTLGRSLGLPGLAFSMLAVQISLTASLFFVPKFRKLGYGKVLTGLLASLILVAAIFGSLRVNEPSVKVQGNKISGKGVAMGTEVEIIAFHENEDRGIKAVKESFETVERIEKIMDPEEEGSDLYALNTNGENWTGISRDTASLMKATKGYSSLLNGSMDPTVKPLVDLWMKRVKDTGKVPDQSKLSDVMKLVDWRKIKTDKTKAKLLDGEMEVTLGSVAKGYAVDMASETLMKNGIDEGLVNIGGDIRAFGNRTWKVAIRHPRGDEKFLGTINLKNNSIATSGDYRKYYLLGSRRVHHIIDPRTGQPANKSTGVSVVSENCTFADALSTGVFVLGPEKGKKILSSTEATGVMVGPQGNISTSENWNYSLQESENWEFRSGDL